LTKAELIDAVAEKCDVTKKVAGSAIDATFEAISSALAKGEGLTLVGFGSFTVTERSPRQGMNPKTKEKIEIAAKKVVKFKPGKGLKDSVN